MDEELGVSAIHPSTEVLTIRHKMTTVTRYLIQQNVTFVELRSLGGGESELRWCVESRSDVVRCQARALRPNWATAELTMAESPSRPTQPA